MSRFNAIAALSIALIAPASTLHAQLVPPAPEPIVDDREEVWNALFDTAITHDSGFVFFDELIYSTGTYAGHNGWDEDFTFEAKLVEMYTPADAVASGYFTSEELAYISTNDMHYTLMTGFMATDKGRAWVVLPVFSGTLTIDSSVWISFGWMPFGTVLPQTMAMNGDCDSWSPPRTWPSPEGDHLWCNEWNTTPCEYQDPDDPGDFVDLDCFDEAFEQWTANLDQITADRSQAADLAAGTHSECIDNADSARTACDNAANAAYEDCVSGIAPAQWITGGGALLIGALAGPVGGILIGGTAIAFEVILDGEKEECLRELGAAQVDCESEHNAAKQACQNQLDAELCAADTAASEASDANDAEFLAALEDCCTPCEDKEKKKITPKRIPD